MIEKFPIVRVTEQERIELEDAVASEFSLTIILNNQELVILLCSPTKLEYLAAGYLFSEGLIKSKSEIKEIELDEEKGTVRVQTEKPVNLPSTPLLASGGGRGRALAIGSTSRWTLPFARFRAAEPPFGPSAASLALRRSLC